MSEEFKSIISARPAFNRAISGSLTNLNGMGSGSRILKTVSEYHQSTGNYSHSGGGGSCSQQIRDQREKEKLAMRHLNDKLASFIEKVRFLDAQNRKLTKEREHVANCLEKKTTTKNIYEKEIEGAQEVLKTAVEGEDDTEEKIEKLDEELKDLIEKFRKSEQEHTSDRENIDELLIKLSNIEAEINLIKRRIGLLEDENGVLRKENAKMNSALLITRSNIDQQALLSLQLKNETMSLVEEIKFVKKAQDEELRDLLAMAARDTTGENREYFKNELTNAMREIRGEYDEMNASLRQELEMTHSLRIQEMETQAAKQNVDHDHMKGETKKLKSQISDLRNKLAELGGRNALLEKQIEESNMQMEDDQRIYEADLNDKDKKIRDQRDSIQALMIEYQMMMDKKQTLDAELAIYRKMLEGEEEGSGLKQLVEQVVRTTGINEAVDTETMRVVKGETSSSSSHARSAKGNIGIQEVCSEAHYIILENSHRSKDEKIGGWKIKRQIDGKDGAVFTFPEEFTLSAASTVKILASGQGDESLPATIVCSDFDSFGLGNNIKTFVYNAAGEERASLLQRELAASTTTE